MRLPISLNLVGSITAALTGRIPYGWGDKADPTWDWHEFLTRCAANGVDCSGWIGWLLYQASHGQVHLTGGSFDMHDQLAALAQSHGDRDRGRYLTEAAKHDGVLRICGFPPKGSEAGHIWGVLNGVTTESHGPQGSVGGVRPRRFDYHTLADNAQWVFEVADASVPPVAIAPSVAPSPPAQANAAPVFRSLDVRDGSESGFVDNTGVIYYQSRHWILARDIAKALPGTILDNTTVPGTLRVQFAPKMPTG